MKVQAEPTPTGFRDRPMSQISGWGGRAVRAYEIVGEDLEHLTRDVPLSRGLGRSYGDSSLPPSSHPVVVGTTLSDRVLGFDNDTGVLRAEAGLSLKRLYQVLLPRGWFTPVSPGTWNVTLGGMVAADVHGKNHHRDGTFGNHVRLLRMRLASGVIVECSPQCLPDLFYASIGGMGLTGHILEVEVQLMKVPSPWIYAETVRVPNLSTFLESLENSARSWPFTVGWLDCLARGRHLGRGILFRGRWARPEEAPNSFPSPFKRPSVPFCAPAFVMSRPLVAMFNGFYYHAHCRRRPAAIVHPQACFYPLDAIGHWNRLYGRAGVTQYQCVLPRASGGDAVARVLEVLSVQGGASFLGVIKDCGGQDPGMLSFPMYGTSLALDLPLRDTTSGLVDALNEQVIAEGGRIYLAKDALSRPAHFRQMEKRLDDWLLVCDRYDPERRLRSAQSVRLFGDLR